MEIILISHNTNTVTCHKDALFTQTRTSWNGLHRLRNGERKIHGSLSERVLYGSRGRPNRWEHTHMAVGERS